MSKRETCKREEDTKVILRRIPTGHIGQWLLVIESTYIWVTVPGPAAGWDIPHLAFNILVSEASRTEQKVGEVWVAGTGTNII